MRAAEIGIVGAGPAGAWAAHRLAKAGARVTIVDDSHPREKPCGGGLTGRALELIETAFDIGSIPSVTISGTIFEHGIRRASVRLPRGHSTPPLVVASRREFDRALLDTAVNAGASLVSSRAREIERLQRGWRIHTRDGSVDCGWLIGADGPTSLVRRRVFRPFSRADLSIATGCFVAGATARDIVIAFETTPPGYLWSFPRPDHLAIGICAQADESTTPRLLMRAKRWMAESISAHGPIERYAWPIPSLSESALTREQPAGDGWMLLGDAAGLVDPITREGIFFALRSGDLAAQSFLDAGDPKHRFAQGIRDEIHVELRRASRLKARFYRPRFVGLLLRALQTSEPIREVMADLVAGRQTYVGLRRRLLSTLEFRLMFELWTRDVLST
jgi:geranylgeranyl diphosphate/geranylgeranyl-bacteriochlorophyllide a reductase